MFFVTELVLSILILWPSALGVASMMEYDLKGRRAQALSVAGCIVGLLLLLHVGLQVKGIKTGFEPDDSAYCGSGPWAWEC